MGVVFCQKWSFALPKGICVCEASLTPSYNHQLPWTGGACEDLPQ